MSDVHWLGGLFDNFDPNYPQGRAVCGADVHGPAVDQRDAPSAATGWVVNVTCKACLVTMHPRSGDKLGAAGDALNARIRDALIEDASAQE